MRDSSAYAKESSDSANSRSRSSARPRPEFKSARTLCGSCAKRSLSAVRSSNWVEYSLGLPVERMFAVSSRCAARSSSRVTPTGVAQALAKRAMIANPIGQILIDLVIDTKSLLNSDGTAKSDKKGAREIWASRGSARALIALFDRGLDPRRRSLAIALHSRYL